MRSALARASASREASEDWLFRIVTPAVLRCDMTLTLTNDRGYVNCFVGRCRKIGAITVQTVVRMARRPDAFAANGYKCNYLARAAKSNR
jgi:hypothetical protein